MNGRLFLLLTFFVFALFLGNARAVELGIDRLQQMDFAPLVGKRVGLVTNQTGIDSRGVKTRVILRKARGVNLVALFSPEHGLDGTVGAGAYVGSRKDSVTGLTVFSLYGPTRKPTPAMLKGIDCLVYDMQDIGCRSYTYISTMAKCMEAAGEAGIEFVVLDRPNPLGGLRIEGPPMELRWISFVGQLPVPYVHGMTAGELARMANARGWTGPRCRLQVIEMRDWNRRMVWADTGLPWIATSPNIPRGSSCAYYVVTGLAGELGGMETACGTPTPFEVFATRPGNASSMLTALQSLNLSGVRFAPYSSGNYEGVRFSVDPHTPADLTALGITMLAQANRFSQPSIFARSPAGKLDLFYKCYGSQSIRDQLERGVAVPRIVDSWKSANNRFEAERGPFLLY
jgi:uncharacterized protein YbbC (DUF1343 family)